MTEILDYILDYGFAIICCLILFWYIYKVQNPMIKILEQIYIKLGGDLDEIQKRKL